MFCEKCGNQVEDGATFCPSCGAQMSTPAAAPVAPAANANQTVQQLVEKAKALPKKVWIIAAVVVLALIVIIAFVNKKSHTINIEDYLEIEFEGEDGYGYATYEIDWDEMEDDLEGKVELSSKAKKYLKKEEGLSNREIERFGEEEFVSMLQWAVEVEFDDNYDLSNGDKVKYEIDFDFDNIEDEFDLDFDEIFNITVNGTEGKETVHGLDD